MLFKKSALFLLIGLLFATQLMGEQMLSFDRFSVLSLTHLEDDHFAAGSKDGTIRIFGMNEQGLYGCEEILTGHINGVWRLTRLSQGGFISGSWDGAIRIWKKDNDTKKYTCSQVLEGHENEIHFIIQWRNGDLLTYSNDDMIIKWIMNEDGDYVPEQVISTKKLYTIRSAIEIYDDSLVFGGRYDGAIAIFTQDFKNKINLVSHKAMVTALTLLDDDILVSGSGNNPRFVSSKYNSIGIWKKNTDRVYELDEFHEHIGVVNQLTKLSGNRFAAASSCGTISIWEKVDAKKRYWCTSELKGHTDEVLSVINVNNTIVSCSYDGTIRIWNDGDLQTH